MALHTPLLSRVALAAHFTPSGCHRPVQQPSRRVKPWCGSHGLVQVVALTGSVVGLQLGAAKRGGSWPRFLALLIIGHVNPTNWVMFLNHSNTPFSRMKKPPREGGGFIC
jgi:hypothetical protein